MYEHLRQIKLDALSAIYLHNQRLHRLQQRNLLLEFLAIAVPVFYIVPRYLLKGSPVAPYIDDFGELLAAGLLILAILKVVYQWQERTISHSVMVRRNQDIKLETDLLLGKKSIGQEVMNQFLRRVTDVDIEDDELLSDSTPAEDQSAYRYALKNLTPGVTTCCMKCGSDPWHMQPGSCTVCGGVPVNQMIKRNDAN